MELVVVDNDLTTDLLEALLCEPVVAVDTETSGLDWRTERLEICQFFAPSWGVVIVRASSERPDRVTELLEAERTLKLFHFAPFDLRFIEGRWGIRTRKVACTKAASKLLDPELPNAAHSLAPLVSKNLGITLDKGAVRTSDWGAGRLSDDQLAYAAADVAYLPALYEKLSARIAARGLDGTYRSVCDYMAVDAHLEIMGVPDPLKY